MSEKKRSVFVVATANNISLLPPELVRKGRFDEIFFVDLPDMKTRETIIQIHLQNRGSEINTFDLATLADTTEGFSGAEIEQGILSAMYTVNANNTGLTTDSLLAEFERTKPLSVVMREQIEELRYWAAERTVPAD